MGKPTAFLCESATGIDGDGAGGFTSKTTVLNSQSSAEDDGDEGWRFHLHDHRPQFAIVGRGRRGRGWRFHLHDLCPQFAIVGRGRRGRGWRFHLHDHGPRAVPLEPNPRLSNTRLSLVRAGGKIKTKEKEDRQWAAENRTPRRPIHRSKKTGGFSVKIRGRESKLSRARFCRKTSSRRTSSPEYPFPSALRGNCSLASVARSRIGRRHRRPLPAGGPRRFL